jgi:hypothetical protein
VRFRKHTSSQRGGNGFVRFLPCVRSKHSFVRSVLPVVLRSLSACRFGFCWVVDAIAIAKLAHATAKAKPVSRVLLSTLTANSRLYGGSHV